MILTTLRRLRHWLACLVWHSDYSVFRSDKGTIMMRCADCGREWSE